jgi:uncharacterized membrane protein (UPF0127 family)
VVFLIRHGRTTPGEQRLVDRSANRSYADRVLRAAVLTLVAALAAAGCGRAPTSPMPPTTTPTVVLLPAGGAPVRVSVEVARTPAQRERGLMYRDKLPSDAGMIFLFDHDEDQSFWMKNTAIPLDMIFITNELTVAGVVANAEPFTLTPRACGAPSRYVLEVNGGFAARHGIGPGTRVQLDGVF